MSPPPPTCLDVVIVGGGPSGLSAALVLGRCLRRVLVCDAGNQRNKPAAVFTGYLSRDPSTPGEFLDICRAQLGRYETVTLRHGTVVDIERADQCFFVTLENGERVQSRMVLLATGLVDKLPEVEGISELYGKAVHSCPYCDGWENRGQSLAVLGGTPAAADLAVELLLWSKDVILCTNGPLECAERTARQLARNRIVVIKTPVERLEREGDALKGVRFTDGSFVPRTALFISPDQSQRSALADRLGCDFCEDSAIQCQESGATCVPGLYVAGNARRGMQLVIVAAAEGTLAAVAMNDALLEADAETGGLNGC